MEDTETEDWPKYSGSSRDAFDGVLKVVDARGQLVRAILTLTAGGREIECVARRELLQDALGKFEVRVIVEGNAIYTTSDLLPRRIEIESIRNVKSGDHLSDWQGRFRIPRGFDNDIWLDNRR